MPQCSTEGCKKDAKEVIKLLLFADGYSEPAQLFATLFACSEEHKAPDGELHKFFAAQWEFLAVGFAQRGYPAPVLEKTQFAWVPVEDWVEFQRQFDGTEDNRKVVAWKN